MITLTERLETMISSKHDISSENEMAMAVCQAIDSSRYNFGLEPIHILGSDTESSSELLPMEYLLRPSGTDGHNLDLAEGLSALRNLGLSSMFDMAVIPRAIEQALSYGDAGLPVSVNIAPESMNDSLFLTELGIYLSHLKEKISNPSDIVFEVPFAGQTTNEAKEWLLQVQEMGFRIAIDNFGKYEPIEISSISRVKPAFVKIDGGLINQAMNGLIGAPSKLRQVVEGIRHSSPKTRIIAPWVASVEQAQRLYQVYHIDAVQGRELPKDRAYFSSQWAFMAYGQKANSDDLN